MLPSQSQLILPCKKQYPQPNKPEPATEFIANNLQLTKEEIFAKTYLPGTERPNH